MDKPNIQVGRGHNKVLEFQICAHPENDSRISRCRDDVIGRQDKQGNGEREMVDVCPYRIRDRMIRKGIPPSIAHKKAMAFYHDFKKIQRVHGQEKSD
jgi:hypothetical protein